MEILKKLYKIIKNMFKKNNNILATVINQIKLNFNFK